MGFCNFHWFFQVRQSMIPKIIIWNKGPQNIHGGKYHTLP